MSPTTTAMPVFKSCNNSGALSNLIPLLQRCCFGSIFSTMCITFSGALGSDFCNFIESKHLWIWLMLSCWSTSSSTNTWCPSLREILSHVISISKFADDTLPAFSSPKMYSNSAPVFSASPSISGLTFPPSAS